MINLGDILEVNIEKMTHDFKGLAYYGSDRFVIFVPDSIVGDKLKIEIISKNKSYASGKIVEIIESKNRIKPLCAIYNACGSCEGQICEYDFLIEQKNEILKDIFKNVISENKIFPVVKSPEILEYRKKIQYPTRQTKNSKRILMGYYKKNSHDLTNIKFCLLAPKILNEIAEFIRNNFPLDCYNEKTNKGILKNFLARFNKQNEAILTFVFNSDKIDKKMTVFSKKLMEKFPLVKGIFVNINTEKSNVILGKNTYKILGEDYIFETLGDKKYKIGAVSFFQINPMIAQKLFDEIKNNINPQSSILDAYGGVGTIGIFLSEKAKNITLIEENLEALKLAKDNYELNNIQNYKILSGDAKANILNFENKNITFDYVILDPPRSGCDKFIIPILAKITKNIVYVSCNPQTLKRDINYLKEYSYNPQFIKGYDMFPYTHHIETLCLLTKEE